MKRTVANVFGEEGVAPWSARELRAIANRLIGAPADEVKAENLSAAIVKALLEAMEREKMAERLREMGKDSDTMSVLEALGQLPPRH
jgi:hypothetical protein